MANVQTYRTIVRRPIRKWIDGGWKEIGSEQATIDVAVDMDAIIDRMARDAMRNKSKKATEVKGAVIVKASNLERNLKS